MEPLDASTATKVPQQQQQHMGFDPQATLPFLNANKSGPQFPSADPGLSTSTPRAQSSRGSSRAGTAVLHPPGLSCTPSQTATHAAAFGAQQQSSSSKRISLLQQQVLHCKSAEAAATQKAQKYRSRCQQYKQEVDNLELYVMEAEAHYKQQLQEQHALLQEQLQAQQVQQAQHQQQLQAQILELQQQLLAATSQQQHQQRPGHVGLFAADYSSSGATIAPVAPPAMPQVSAASGAAPWASSHTNPEDQDMQGLATQLQSQVLQSQIQRAPQPSLLQPAAAAAVVSRSSSRDHSRDWERADKIASVVFSPPFDGQAPVESLQQQVDIFLAELQQQDLQLSAPQHCAACQEQRHC